MLSTHNYLRKIPLLVVSMFILGCNTDTVKSETEANIEPSLRLYESA